IALGHKLLKIMFVLLSRKVPYRDSTVDYEALAIKRNILVMSISTLPSHYHDSVVWASVAKH
ncbi:MAG: hypothetical protein H7839_22850, partial [Magnetococcus sp. YQC-5]